MVDEENFHFTAIVRIDSARCIEHRHAMLEGKAGTRTDLRLKALGQLHGKARRVKRLAVFYSSGKGLRCVFWDGGGEVHACGLHAFIGRER